MAIFFRSYWFFGVFGILGFVASENAFCAKTSSNGKEFVISMPVVTLGREGAYRAEYNLGPAALGVEWMEWGYRERKDESSLTEQESGEFFLSQGKNISLMVGRYSNPDQMSGFNWGLGAGYREVDALWSTNPSLAKIAQIDSQAKNHHLKIKGPTVSGRLGWRYVGESVGIALGSYIGIKYFQSSVEDLPIKEDSPYTLIGYDDKNAIKNRLLSKLHIGFEFGWAF